MTEMTGPEYEHAVSAAKMQNFLPYLKETVGRLQVTTVNRMAVLQDEGKLSPEMALAGWSEYLAYRRLLKNTQTRTVIGAMQVDMQ